jgi:hypothetical protein
VKKNAEKTTKIVYVGNNNLVYGHSGQFFQFTIIVLPFLLTIVSPPPIIMPTIVNNYGKTTGPSMEENPRCQDFKSWYWKKIPGTRISNPGTGKKISWDAGISNPGTGKKISWDAGISNPGTGRKSQALCPDPFIFPNIL